MKGNDLRLPLTSEQTITETKENNQEVSSGLRHNDYDEENPIVAAHQPTVSQIVWFTFAFERQWKFEMALGGAVFYPLNSLVPYSILMFSNPYTRTVGVTSLIVDIISSYILGGYKTQIIPIIDFKNINATQAPGTLWPLLLLEITFQVARALSVFTIGSVLAYGLGLTKNYDFLPIFIYVAYFDGVSYTLTALLLNSFKIKDSCLEIYRRCTTRPTEGIVVVPTGAIAVDFDPNADSNNAPLASPVASNNYTNNPMVSYQPSDRAPDQNVVANNTTLTKNQV